MKAIGYAGARLYGCKYGPFSIVMCAPDRKTALGAFEIWLRDKGITLPSPTALNLKPAKTLGNRPLFWAQVDVTQS